MDIAEFILIQSQFQPISSCLSPMIAHRHPAVQSLSFNNLSILPPVGIRLDKTHIFRMVKIVFNHSLSLPFFHIAIQCPEMLRFT